MSTNLNVETNLTVSIDERCAMLADTAHSEALNAYCHRTAAVWNSQAGFRDTAMRMNAQAALDERAVRQFADEIIALRTQQAQEVQS